MARIPEAREAARRVAGLETRNALKIVARLRRRDEVEASIAQESRCLSRSAVLAALEKRRKALEVKS